MFVNSFLFSCVLCGTVSAGHALAQIRVAPAQCTAGLCKSFAGPGMSSENCDTSDVQLSPMLQCKQALQKKPLAQAWKSYLALVCSQRWSCVA